jgi:hypothetical protein
MASLGILPRREAGATGPDRKPRTRWISIGIIVVVAAVLASAAAYVFFAPAANDTSGGVLTYTVPDTKAEPAGGPCSFPTPASTDASQIVPIDTVWELTPGSSMAAPRSASAGPLHVADGVSSCYARTPSGALLATANFVSELANTRTDLNKLVDTKAVHSAGYDALNQRMQAWLAQDRAAEPTRQIAGYRLTTFDGNTATLEVVQRNTSGTGVGLMATISYVMRWENDDWKLVPMIDGLNPPSMALKEINQPYIPWAGA